MEQLLEDYNEHDWILQLWSYICSHFWPPIHLTTNVFLAMLWPCNQELAINYDFPNQPNSFLTVPREDKLPETNTAGFNHLNIGYHSASDVDLNL